MIIIHRIEEKFFYCLGLQTKMPSLNLKKHIMTLDLLMVTLLLLILISNENHKFRGFVTKRSNLLQDLKKRNIVRILRKEQMVTLLF